jgi:hypothetical protein
VAWLRQSLASLRPLLRGGLGEERGPIVAVGRRAGQVQRRGLEGGHGFHGNGVHYMLRVGKAKAGNMRDGEACLEFPT